MSDKYYPGEATEQAVEQLLVVEHAFMDVERFRKRYLKRFWENDPQVYADWLAHIGKPFRRCDLVQSGRKVGEVPPLAKQVALVETGRGENSLYERLSTLQNHIKRLPHAAEKLTERTLRDLFPDPQVDLSLLKEWDALFKAFGYPGLITDTSEAADENQETPQDQTPVQFDGYEEL